MADRYLEPDTAALRARWGNFSWEPQWAEKARAAIARYPEGRQRSAVMALLDYAQRQVGEATNTQGWLPIPVIEFVARKLGMPVVRVLEVATRPGPPVRGSLKPVARRTDESGRARGNPNVRDPDGGEA